MADTEKDFMGLMTFSGEQPTLREAKIAKNYLDEKELQAMEKGYLESIKLLEQKGKEQK